MYSKISLIVFLMLLIAIPASGQPAVNTPVRACTGQQFTAIADAIDDFSTAYADISRRLSAPSPDFDTIMARADALQRDWWSNVVPDLPPCAISTEITPLIGQLVDELLLTLLYMDANLMSFANDHLETYSALAANFMDYVDSITALVD